MHVLPLLFTAAFSMGDLVNLINQNQLTTIEEVIPALPESLRHGYTLQYKGHGLQEGSYENPRAIVFGDDASFVFTFNGDPSQAQHHTLEIMQFSGDHFELYELAFPVTLPLTAPQKNPAQCTSCHGSDPAPIWGRYPFWRGVYGSSDDQLLGNERTQFLKNRAAWSQHPRYQHLIAEEGSPVAPYSTVEVQTMSFRPNGNMGSFLARLNAKAIAARVKNDLPNMLLATPSYFHCKKQISINGSNFPERLGTTPQAWGQLSHAQWQLTDPYYFDGFFMTTPNYVLAELSTAFFARYPKLAEDYEAAPLAAQTLKQTRLVQTQRDRDIVETFDRLGVPLKLNKKDCKDFVNYVTAELPQ